MPDQNDDVSRNRKHFPEDDWISDNMEETSTDEYFEDKMVNEDLFPDLPKLEDKSNQGIMGTILKVVKRFGAIIGGVVGTGGSMFAGLDLNTAVLIGATAAVAIIAGDLALAKEFKELFDDDPTNDKIEL